MSSPRKGTWSHPKERTAAVTSTVEDSLTITGEGSMGKEPFESAKDWGQTRRTQVRGECEHGTPGGQKRDRDGTGESVIVEQARPGTPTTVAAPFNTFSQKNPHIPRPKRLRIEDLRPDEIVIPRITEWQFETGAQPEDGESMECATPRGLGPEGVLPARLRPITWRNIGKDARRDGLWDQALDFLRWEGECRQPHEQGGTWQEHETGGDQAVSNEAEETGEAGGITAWGEKGGDGRGRQARKVTPFECLQLPLPNVLLSGGAEEGELTGNKPEEVLKLGGSPEEVRPLEMPNTFATPGRVGPAAQESMGSDRRTEAPEALCPSGASVLPIPALEDCEEPSASQSGLSVLRSSSGLQVKASGAANLTFPLTHTAASNPSETEASRRFREDVCSQ